VVNVELGWYARVGQLVRHFVGLAPQQFGLEQVSISSNLSRSQSHRDR